MDPSEIPGYTPLETIAEDALTVCWKSRQDSLNRVVRVIRLRSSITSAPERMKAIIDEARVAANFKDPDLIHVYDVVQHAGNVYLVVEYPEATSVLALMEHRGPLALDTSRAIVRNSADALRRAWSACHLAHRAITPWNVLIDTTQRVRIDRFGLPKSIDWRSGPEHGEGVGDSDWGYAAPEQLLGGTAIDFRADVYALGAAWYHMLTGAAPFPAERGPRDPAAVLPDPRELRRVVPPGMSQVIARMTGVRPRDRCANWGDIIAAIDALDVAPARATPVEAKRRVVVSSAAVEQAADRALTRRHSPVRVVAVLILLAWFALLAWKLFERPALMSRTAAPVADRTDPSREPAVTAMASAPLAPSATPPAAKPPAAATPLPEKDFEKQVERHGAK